MNSEALINVTDFKAEITLLPKAQELQNLLLNQSRTVKSIEDAFDAECAADVLKNLTQAVKEMETARKEVKAPVLDLGKSIDAVAKSFTNLLEKEKSRISKILGAYEAEQRRIRQEAERKAREAEEAARREAEKALAQGDEKAATVAAEKIATSQAQVAESSHRPEGTAVRETWQFEVTDMNALYDAAPHLCRVEPDNAAIRAAIKKSQSIPGLRIWKEAKSYVR